MGIPSSIPRFRQGPVNVWFDAFSFVLFGKSFFSPVVLTAILTSAGFCWIFLFFAKQTKHRLFAWSLTLFISTLPVIIDHTRATFYFFAIPFCTALYFHLLSLSQRPKYLFWAAAAFGLLFQWEIAAAPLAVCFLIAWKACRASIRKRILMIFAGLSLGFFPQILFDIQNRCAQLCLLPVWAGYRVSSFFIPGTEHAGSFAKVADIIRLFWQHWSTLFGVLGIPVLLFSVWSIWNIRKAQAPITARLAALGFIVLTAAICLHDAPSSAYVPPFVILSGMLLCWFFSHQSKKIALIASSILLLASLYHGYSMISNHYFVPSIRTILDAAAWIDRTSPNASIQLISYDPDAKFSSYLQYLEFLLNLRGRSVGSPGIRYIVSFDGKTLLPEVNSVVVQFGGVRIARRL